jgi:type I restriction enzyme, R subunit
MSRDENQTCQELIEPALEAAGWTWSREVMIGPGRVNLSGERMYDEHQHIVADYVLKLYGMPLAILEAKREDEDASDGMQQGSRYAQRLSLRFSIATNGHEYIVTDNRTGEFHSQDTPPPPGDVLHCMGLNTIPRSWKDAFLADWHVDQISRKKVRPYQERAITEALYQFSQDNRRVLLLMATGTGKTFTVFQLVWKLLQTDILPRANVLFLTDRNSLKGQAYRAFNGFPTDERVTIDKNAVKAETHLVGKVFFANYQNLDEELDGKKLYEHYAANFFDLIVVDECHRSGFGDWFGVLEHFGKAYQLGLTATPRELYKEGRDLSPEELRRDSYEYFGEPIFTYSLKQAVEDGYLVPYLLEQRVTNVDEEGYDGPDGRRYETKHFERDVSLPDRTIWIAEDLYAQLKRYGLENEKSIVFCVNDTHAALMAQELRRISGDPEYAARITRAERNSHQLERNFQEVGRTKPRVAVTVDLLTTGYDAPDVKNIVFVRPLRSSILYKQMKGRGTRLCDDPAVDKRYFTIWDYSGASTLEDSEFDGHPANQDKARKPAEKPRKESDPKDVPVEQGVTIELSDDRRFVCLADGRKIPFEDYKEQSKDAIRTLVTPDLKGLLAAWIDKRIRQELRAELRDQDVHVAAFRHFFDLPETDDVDVLSKVAFDLVRVPERRDRVAHFWEYDQDWLLAHTGEENTAQEDRIRLQFWETCLDHYSLFGVDDLEDARTFRTPQFVGRFGSFTQLLRRYGDPKQLRSDLEEVKRHLYVPLSA